MSDSSHGPDDEIREGKPQEDGIPTTIVGARSGRDSRRDDIPRGIEVLLKKAAVDPEFCGLLLDKRSAVASEIDLELSPLEAATLDCIPRPQIEKIIEKTTVRDEHRRVFLGKVAAAMLALVGLPLTVLGQGADPQTGPQLPNIVEKPAEWRSKTEPQLPRILGEPVDLEPKKVPQLPHNWGDRGESQTIKVPRTVYVSAGIRPSRPPSGPVPLAPPPPLPCKVKK